MRVTFKKQVLSLEHMGPNLGFLILSAFIIISPGLEVHATVGTILCNKIQPNLSMMATLGTKESSHCREVAIIGR